MSYGDDEILQDFLVEAGEILEQLSEQLVQLEERPDDAELLNAIFRGFHTVKGGAGFLQIGAMVDACHVTENLFDVLRKGQLEVSPELVDVTLQALDAVNGMYAALQHGETVDAAPASLLQQIEAAAQGSVPVAADPEPAAQTPSQASSSAAPVDAAVGSGEDISDAEFEALLDELHGSGKHGGQPVADNAPNLSAEAATSRATTGANSDEISDAEFEALLDELHGAGQHSGRPAPTDPNLPQSAPRLDPRAGEEISDAEFEALLDQLHGKGQHGGTPAGESVGEGERIQQEAFGDLLQDLTEKPRTGPNPALGSGPEATAVQLSAPKAPRSDASVKSAKAEELPSPPATKAAAKPAAREGATAEATVRVDTQRLDDIMNMVGELVLVRNRLLRLGSSNASEDLAKTISHLDVVTADLQASVMQTRMQPIKKVFGRFPRVVRDLARSLQKEVALELVGEETDLDKNLVEALADPLIHLVRNSVDHGIEMPDAREAAGKPRKGTVVLAAAQEGDHITLSITDDGRGMDPEKLKDVAVNRGVMERDAADRLTDSECFELIFAPGFSTKQEVSDVSGRGVGMDVVKTKISQLNGAIVIHSEPGRGTRIEIRVPLTLAIMPTLMVMLEEQAFALPLVNVNEIFDLDLSRTNVVDGQEVVVVRDRALPLFYLKEWLIACGPSAAQRDRGHVVIVSVGTQRVGFVVDQLLGQEEVVIKPLGRMLAGTPGMAGATITGDGKIALILDVPSMLKRYARRRA